MLEQASPLNRSSLQSVLKGQSRLRPNGGSHRRRLMASLMLTSLVDAFSILVIFLIMNHSASQESLDFDQTLALPKAQQSQVIQNGVVVKIQRGQFFVDSQPVKLNELLSVLENMKKQVDAKKDGLIVVADQKMDFADLSPLISVGSQAGFSKFKFVVERGE